MVQALYEAGATERSISQQLHVAQAAVAEALKRSRVQGREPGRPCPLPADKPLKPIDSGANDADVRQALKRWSIPVRDPESWDRRTAFQILAPDPLPADLLRHLYCDLGLTIHHISILCGIGTTGVRGQLQRVGITARPPGPSPWTRRNIRQ